MIELAIVVFVLILVGYALWDYKRQLRKQIETMRKNFKATGNVWMGIEE